MVENNLRGNYEFEAIEKHCTNAKGQDIFGLLYKPKKEGKVPAIMVSPEFGNVHEDQIEYGKFFASLGIATYTFDFCGNGTRSRSDGTYEEMSIMTSVEDLEAIYAEVKSWDFVDEDKIIPMGLSQGGFITTVFAARHIEDFRGLILCYPAYIVVDYLHGRFGTLDQVPERFDFLDWAVLGKVYAEDAWNLKPYEDLARFGKPVVLLHGDADDVVPIDYSIEGSKIGDYVDFHVIHGASHDFVNEFFEEATSHMVDLLKKVEVL